MTSTIAMASATAAQTSNGINLVTTQAGRIASEYVAPGDQQDDHEYCSHQRHLSCEATEKAWMFILHCHGISPLVVFNRFNVSTMLAPIAPQFGKRSELRKYFDKFHCLLVAVSAL